MNLKVMMLSAAIILIIISALSGTGIKEKLSSAIMEDVPEYNCENNICTSCIINGNACSCGQHVCDCGNVTVEKDECSLY